MRVLDIYIYIYIYIFGGGCLVLGLLSAGAAQCWGICNVGWRGLDELE